jgi:uncharacterized hydrophobic protein (TIGR00271 family)
VTTQPRHKAEGERSLFLRIRLRASAEQRNAIYQSILDSSHIDLEYLALLALAALIALFGLLENSAAVIIGAMLISPLMNPILSVALALLLGDGKLGKRSAAVLAISIGGVIAITWLVASLTPLKQATAEILARTTPNLLDLFIAFLSGLAGTLALRGGSVALTILPGVAIAVAVLPPLSVVGYGLSTNQRSIAGGAFLLFITNLVSIIISAVAVFRATGFRPYRHAEKGPWNLKFRVGVSAILLLLLSIPLFLTLRKVAIQVAMRAELQRDLNAAFQSDRASVSDLTFLQTDHGLLIRTTLQTTQYFDTKTIQSVEESLRRKYGQGTQLVVDQIFLTEGGIVATPEVQQRNPISGGVVKPTEQKATFDFKESSLQSLGFVQAQLDTVLAGTAVQRKAAPEMALTSTPPLVLKLQLASPEPLGAQTISFFASQLASKLGVPVQLHGHIELRGSSFQLILAPAKPNQGLTAGDQKAMGTLIQQVQQGNLQLQARCAPGSLRLSDKQIPQLFSEVRRFLMRSGLKSSQWTIGFEPLSELPSTFAAGNTTKPTGSGEKSPPAVASGPFHCDLKAFQDF